MATDNRETFKENYLMMHFGVPASSTSANHN